MSGIVSVADPATWPSLPTLVEARTDQILGILREHDTRATFFVLGWIAERYPTIVRKLVDAGHEIASHTYWHQLIYEQSPASFRADVAASVAIIEQQAGVKPRGFRAPSFSITPGTEWAFDVLLELGFTYDASLFPAAREHGGYPLETGPQMLATPQGRRIAELPMSVMTIAKRRLCYAGGGYMRLLPLWLIRRGIDQESAGGKPTVAYLHPRDLAPDCPRAPMPLHRRFKCYVGLATTERKLRALLRHYRWGTCAAVLRESIGFEADPAVTGTPV